MDTDVYSKIKIEDAEEICKRIREEAKTQVRDIIERAQKERQRIIDEANLEAENKRQEILKKLEKELEKTKQRIFSTINLEKKKLFLEEKGKFIGVILNSVKDIAKEFRSSGDYKTFLEKAILQGIKIIDQNGVDIFYSSLDDKIFKDDFIDNIEKLCQAKLNHKITLNFKKGDFKDTGIIVQSIDERLIYDNRFLSRLKRAYDDVYMDLLREIA